MPAHVVSLGEGVIVTDATCVVTLISKRFEVSGLFNAQDAKLDVSLTETTSRSDNATVV